jgi:hypothetical protein
MHNMQQPEEVFQKIDMHNGDRNVCWEWTGYIDKNNKCLCTIDKRRLNVQRLVYELVFGIQLARNQPLIMSCGNNKCCNPEHMTLTKLGEL